MATSCETRPPFPWATTNAVNELCKLRKSQETIHISPKDPDLWAFLKKASG